MNRRSFIAVLAAVPALPMVRSAFAHTPYRQWKVFRERYLQIMTSRTDPDGDALGDRLAETLREDLPLSRAMVSRAPHLERIGSLITTDQAKFAVLAREHAQALARGEPPFADYGPYPLYSIVEAGHHLLVSRQDVPLHHAYLIVATLMERADTLGVRIPDDGAGGIARHPGVAAFARGEIVEPPA